MHISEKSPSEKESGQKPETTPSLPDIFVKRKDRNTVRWYIMTLPVCHKGGPAKALHKEQERRRRNKEQDLGFFAPEYTEVKKVKGQFVSTQRPLLYNYVFVHSSEREINRMKRGTLHAYNFLPRVKKNGREAHYPYLSDDAMENLRWVADAYSGTVPVYVPCPGKLVKGDRVRITEGPFSGVEATVIKTHGTRSKEIAVCIDDWIYVPLLNISEGQYEIISLNEESKTTYSNLDDDRTLMRLHHALHASHTGSLTDADRSYAADVADRLSRLSMKTDVMRSKLCSLLLMAHTITGDTDKRDETLHAIATLLPLMKAEQARATLCVTLYGCTDNALYHRQAHEIVDAWAKEGSPKKSKRLLMERLADYDSWYGH